MKATQDPTFVKSNNPVHIRCKSCSSCGFCFNKQVRGISKTSSGLGILDHSGNLVDNISCSAPVQIGIDNNSSMKSSSSYPSHNKADQKWAKRKDKINAEQRFLYNQDPESKQKSSWKNYYLHPSPVKKRALDAYYRKHELNKAKQRKIYKDKKDKILDKCHIAALVSCSISRKYSRLRTGPSRLTVCIKNIVAKLSHKSVIEKHLFAEHLVKSCLQYRDSYKSDFVKQFTSLRTSLLATTLTKASETTSHSQIHDVLCGQGFHTSTTESFFPKLLIVLKLLTWMENYLLPSFHHTLLML